MHLDLHVLVWGPCHFTLGVKAKGKTSSNSVDSYERPNEQPITCLQWQFNRGPNSCHVTCQWPIKGFLVLVADIGVYEPMRAVEVFGSLLLDFVYVSGLIRKQIITSMLMWFISCVLSRPTPTVGLFVFCNLLFLAQIGSGSVVCTHKATFSNMTFW